MGARSNTDWFDFKVREAMPGRGAETLLSLCEDEHLRQRIARCMEISAWASETQTPAQWVRRLDELAETLYRPGILEVANDRGALAAQRSHVAAASAWVDAVASVTSFWPDPNAPISLREFWRASCDAIDTAEVRTRDDRRNAVHVMSVYEARQWDVSALFVCGFTDRDFPRKHPQNLLFPDDEIDVLRKSGIPLRKACDLDCEERALFDALRTRATQSLIVSWPAHDAAGKRVQSSRHLKNWQVAVEIPQPCRPAARISAENGGIAGRLESPALIAALAEQHRRISVTGLEDMAQCRFKFFAGRTLGLRSRPERPDERLQPRVTGLILHEALEAWLKNNREGDFVPIFETAFDTAVRQKNLPPGYRLELERIQLRNIAQRVSATERWTPAASEAEVEISLAFPGGIAVTGRIDRIDLMNDRDCIVVDYKSSRSTSVERLIDSPLKLQGPLYALALRENRSSTRSP